MTAAVIRTVAFAKPAFVKPTFAKPSPATLRKVETFLTITLLAQMVGLAIRYTI